uniref:Uncharacterized protein n=1 Tax=Ditylenchus dipsaci TaxID=166011 RepID=A0A915CNR1_9BILA
MALRRDGRSSTNRWTFAQLDRLSEDSDALLNFLDTHGIISLNRRCSKCGKDDMKLNERANGQWRFRCGKRINPGGKTCSGEQGLLANSFLMDAKQPIIVTLKFIYLWLSGMEQQKIRDEIGSAGGQVNLSAGGQVNLSAGGQPMMKTNSDMATLAAVSQSLALLNDAEKRFTPRSKQYQTAPWKEAKTKAWTWT